jgi:hypothetical protein
METTSIINNTSTSKVEMFFNTHDVVYVSENAVFKNMSTGDEYRGREAIGGMLEYFYHVAFDAKAILNNSIIKQRKAVLEATFSGKHIGEFAGIPATNTEVNVPMCISYDLDDEALITEGRIYMLTDVLFRQLQSK